MEDIDISLITVMAYNDGFILNLKEVFDSLKVPTIKNPPTTKKGKEIDIKGIKVKKGTIISAKWGKFIKGVDKRPSGKYKFYVNLRKGTYFFEDTKEMIDKWKLIGKVKSILDNNTIGAFVVLALNTSEDTYKFKLTTKEKQIVFEGTYDWVNKLNEIGEITLMEKIDQKICEVCETSPAKFATPKAKKPLYCRDCAEQMEYKKGDKELVEIIEKKSFPHQISIDYAYKEGMNINMFLFRKNIKIAGFQYEKYTIRMIKGFWKRHLLPSGSAISFYTDNDPGYIFESTMTNSSFETHYNFALTKANTLINKLKQDDSNILKTDFEPTIDTGVKIILKAVKPKDYSYNKITWLRDSGVWEDSIVFEILDRNKSNEEDKKTTVYLYDERFMISTRYGVVLKPSSNFVNDILDSHRKELEIKKVDVIKKYKPTFI